jgi:hypothetical protein
MRALCVGWGSSSNLTRAMGAGCWCVVTAQSDARSRGGGKRVTFQIRRRI